MSPAAITILTFATTALLVGGLVLWIYERWLDRREQVRERVRALTTGAKSPSDTQVVDHRQLRQAARAARGSWKDWTHDLLAQSGWNIEVKHLAWCSAACGLCAAVVLYGLTRQWGAALFGLLAAGAPVAYLKLRRDARKRTMTWQLPEAFDAMGRAVRSGQTIQAAFQLVGDDFERPVSDEFRRCYVQQNLGMTFDAALRDMSRRTGIMELQILVVALVVQSRSGGNLADLLANLSEMVRKRLKLRQKVKALTGEGRLQALTLIVLPILAFLILYFASPDYIGALLDRPMLLGVTAGMQVVGAFWIQRIVNFDY